MDRREALRVKTPKHIKDLIPDPKNRRKHNPRNLGMLTDALHKVGAARSIVIDEQNEILAGNGVVEAAADAGITKVQVVEADGNTIVAVRRKGLTAEQKRQLAIYDNRTAELADWDLDRLRADLAEGEDLSAFFHDDELAALLESEVEPKAGFTDPDAVPEQRATDIKLGDLFELGKHRLLCGDSTKAEDVVLLMDGSKPRLMVTDPPYGLGGYAGRSGKHSAVRGDDMNAGEIVAMLQALPVLDHRYIWCEWRTYPTFMSALGLPNALIVWAKPWPGMGSGYRRQHEFACYYGDFKATDEFDLWSIDYKSEGVNSTWQRTEKCSLHPTQKPVECMARPMRNHRADLVYEPFAGSGSTVIAAEQQNCAASAIEIEPKYCQVIIDRWEQFTGKKAVKVGEAIHA
jgi:hypothetical protein